MKNLSIKVLIILVVALAGVSTAYATPPTTVTGDWSVSNVAWGPDGEFIPTIALTGALEGEFTHGFENGRADHRVRGLCRGCLREFQSNHVGVPQFD